MSPTEKYEALMARPPKPFEEHTLEDQRLLLVGELLAKATDPQEAAKLQAEFDALLNEGLRKTIEEHRALLGDSMANTLLVLLRHGDRAGVYTGLLTFLPLESL